jgi:hypothetical protein
LLKQDWLKQDWLKQDWLKRRLPPNKMRAHQRGVKRYEMNRETHTTEP